MTDRELRACRKRLERFLADLVGPLGRSERRHWAAVYVRGLLLDGERKSIERLASRLEDGNTQALQQFVGQSPWEWEQVWKLLAQRMSAELEAEPVWVLDDTGFPKKGEHSVGVAVQYSGTLGGTGRCQVGVSLHLVAPLGSQPLGWRLYLPQSWAADPQRRAAAGIPSEVDYQPKWRLALELVDQALGWGLPKRVVLADADYGEKTALREGLAARGLRYVVGADSHIGVWLETPRPVRRRQTLRGERWDYGGQKSMPLREAVERAGRWRRIRWREGTKGWLEGEFCVLRVRPSHGYQNQRPPLEEVWLLAEKTNAKRSPVRYYLSSLPARYSLRRLVKILKSRGAVEQDYRQMKRE